MRFAEMKINRSFLALAVLFTTLLFTGCGGKTAVSAVIGKEFTLSVGQTASIKGENLDVAFVAVTEDSRCPTGAQCIWQGQSKSLIKLSGGNMTENIELVEPGLTSQVNPRQFRNYQISFHLLPYPEVGKEIKDGQYRLNLTVTRVQGLGTFEGDVTIGPLTPVQTTGAPPPVPCEVYKARKVMVYDASGVTMIKQVDIDCKGHYAVELQPGAYTIDINRAGIDHSSEVPKKIDIKSGETVTLNIDIDTGIR
jgi:hypothetical protein